MKTLSRSQEVRPRFGKVQEGQSPSWRGFGGVPQNYQELCDTYLDLAEATAPLADYARQVAEEPVILTVGGKPVAALISIENADWETVALSAHPAFMALIARSRARQAAEGGIPAAEMRRRLGLDRKNKRA